jgi:hypothetical protein
MRPLRSLIESPVASRPSRKMRPPSAENPHQQLGHRRLARTVLAQNRYHLPFFNGKADIAQRIA